MLPGQLSIPGTEREPIRATLERKARESLKPQCYQKPLDIGLFGDEALQSDLLDMPMFMD